MEKDKIIKPYFSHDITADKDEKIIKMFFEFRKRKNDYSEETLKDLLPVASFGLYWLIVQYMHQNNLKLSDIEMLADSFRISEDVLKSVLDDFGLFRQEDGYYISDRILRNMNYVESKNERKREAANVRWLLSAFNKAYEKFFGEAPILSPEEINKLVQYSKSIKDLKELLPDIIYTLKGLKFDTDLNFKPCANWLLKDNNLGRLINGEFGKLKHKKTEKELKAEQEEARKTKESEYQPDEMETILETMSSKAEAISLIAEKHSSSTTAKGLIIYPTAKMLMEKFDITKKEVEEYVKNA